METEEIKIEELPTEGAIPTEETPIEVASEESYADIEEKLVDDEDAPEIIDKENIPGYLKITS